MGKNAKSIISLVISLLVFVWLVGSIVFIAGAGRSGSYDVMLMLMGQFFLVIGVIALIIMVSESQPPFLGVGVMAVGLTLGALGLVFRFADDDTKALVDRLIPLGVFWLMALGGVGLCVGSWWFKKYRLSRFERVTAVVAELEKARDKVNGHWTDVYIPTYELTYGGERVRLKDTVGTPDMEFKVGDERQLLIGDDLKSFRVADREKKYHRLRIIIGLAVTAFAVCVTAAYLVNTPLTGGRL